MHLQLYLRNNIPTMMTSMTATPPIAPPAIAPALLDGIFSSIFVPSVSGKREFFVKHCIMCFECKYNKKGLWACRTVLYIRSIFSFKRLVTF